MLRTTVVRSVLVPLLISISLFSAAQPGKEIVGIPTVGAPGIKVPVAELMQRADEANKHPRPLIMRREFEAERHPVKKPDAPAVSKWPMDNLADNTRVDRTQRIEATQTIHSNFLGITLFGEGQAIPPDSNGDISSTQVCVIANTWVKFYNRNTVCDAAQTTAVTGTVPLASPAFSSDLNTFFASVAPTGISDPHVRFDRLTGRWFIVAIDVASASNRCVIAMSNGPTISALANFTFFFFVFDALGSPPGGGYTGGFFDYPTLGVDANALYIGGRMFTTGGSYLGASLFVVRKSSLTGGGPIVTTAFHLIGNTTTGVYTPQGVDNDNPAATEGYFIAVDQGVFSQLDIHRITTPGGTPVASALITLTVPTTVFPQSQPANGTPGTNIDALDDRLFAAMIRKNKITGVSSLWTAHNIEVNSSGVANSSGNRNGSRWYQIDNMTTTPTLTQSGTLFDPAASNPRGFWIPSIGSSGQGHSILGFSSAASNQRADCGVAGRYRTDASGTIQSFTLATTSASAYNQSGSPERWGDYSQVVVDPLDDMTIWTFQEYCNGTNSWGVRAIQLKAPPPATPIAPGTIGCGNNGGGGNRSTAVTLNGTSSNNSEFFDPGTGYTNRLAVTTTGSGASISNLVFVNPTQITFNVVWPPALAGTTQTLTITNPDCQIVTVNYTLPNGCAPLPVHWLSFTGSPANRRVLLNWITDQEPDNLVFDIERKNFNGLFEKIGRVNSKGINGGNYEFYDDSPEEINFYRLKQINVDGSFTYSNIVKVELSNIFTLVVYPNPVKDQLTIEMPEAYRKGTLRVINTTGEVVFTSTLNNTYRKTIDVSNMPSGTYIIEVRSVTGAQIQKTVLVQKNDP